MQKFIVLFIQLFIFRIAVAPHITAHPQNATPPEGQNVTLSCNATGDPAPLIFWIKGGSIITKSGNPRISFEADNKTLTIRNVSRNDSGQYRCVANNSAGEAISSAATLNVQCKYSTFLRPPYCFHFEPAEDGVDAQH